ncbi:MAG: FKBP-type peptidyl-prolyl cis-trans isomerase, partial [Vicinamibacteria bacterium]
MKRLFAFFLTAGALVLTSACGGNSTTTPTTTGQLVIEDITVGTGATAAVGDTLNVNYALTLQDGTPVESGPFTFVLGVGQVIPGWDQGLVGMRVGGKRRLTVPPNLAYGSQGQGAIPPNATLI